MDVESAHCLRCRTVARRVAFNADASVYMHSAVVGSDPLGLPVLCGGEVVRAPDAPPGPRPGEVVPCQSVSPSFRVHLVRLGRLASRRNGSWHGTALCGLTPRGNSTHWVPTPNLAESSDLCQACAVARGAGYAV